MIPSFAVVGHPNKGKSSIVATLAEDASIAISDTPGTTRQAQGFVFEIAGEPLYRLIDTPGFQRARAVLDELRASADAAHERRDAVSEFVRAHSDDPRFADEVALLQPILDGAGILYVVDGAKPYGREYEIEMQILQWTGQPRMALINRIGPGDYVEDWRRALGQHFSLVREFNAMSADFDKRVALLRGFAELSDDNRAPIDRAIEAMTAEKARRLRLSAAMIADGLIRALSMTASADLPEDADKAALTEKLSQKLRRQVQREEGRTQQSIAALYRHDELDTTDSTISALDGDLFTSETWQLFGLSRKQLAISGALSGAVAGTGIDVLLGGASLLLGAGVGAVIGSASAWFGGDELAKVTVLGQSLGGEELTVGPIKAANFPWVWLGRALHHHRLVSERNHARREQLTLDLAGAANTMDSAPDAVRSDLSKALATITKNADGDGPNQADRSKLHSAVQSLLESH
ncbi:MAG: GTPase/DUF3482 domain-containing protein [Pseudomonadaceae bacterium]|nr:GTPase/DUF3482 domain-containing protein [Pseudomonadaceae bacterium]